MDQKINELQKTFKRTIKDLTKLQKITAAITGSGAVAFIISLTVLRGTGYYQTSIILSLMLAGFPYVSYKYWRYKRIASIERYLPDYLRDVSEALSSGMTLSKALETSTKGSYGALSEEMEKTANQISWGLPFEEAMERFMERNSSYLTRKAITVIIESHQSGGDIARTLRTVANDIKTIGRMKKRRESKLRVYTISIYFIFFLFLGIIVALTLTFIPATPDLNRAAEIIGGTPADISPREFQNFFFHLCLIQGFFGGLIAGQMGKGSVMAGAKHSLVMIISTLVVFQLFLAPTPFHEAMAEQIVELSPGPVEEESAHGVYTVDRKITSEKVAETVREKAEEQEIEGFRDIESDQILFLQMNCEPCRENKIRVTAREIEAVETTSVGARVRSRTEDEYEIILGEPPEGAEVGGAPIG